MNIRGTNYEIVNSNGTIYTNVSGLLAPKQDTEDLAIITLKAFHKGPYTDQEVHDKVYEYAKQNPNIFLQEPIKNIHNTLNAKGPEEFIKNQPASNAAPWNWANATQQQAQPTPPADPNQKYTEADKNRVVATIQKLHDFFKEFEFTPSDRLTDTLYRKGSVEAIRKHIINYFKLTDHLSKDVVLEKVKSQEFTNIAQGIANDSKLWQTIVPEPVNKRLIIKFGPAGSGKTVTATAMASTPDKPANVLLCSEDLHPDELQKQFDFNDENGFPVWKAAPIIEAAQKGEKIVLDEFGLVPKAGQRFLQGLLDGKKEALTAIGNISIKEGFQIIATMNLYEGGDTYRIAEPLVDRASDLEEMIASPATIVSHLWG